MKSTAGIGMRMVAGLAAALLLPACAPLDRLTPQEHLDKRSGDTLLVVNQALVFARERSDVAVRARDYVTLVAVEADRAGQFSAYLLAYRWSTVDRRMAALPSAEAGELHIFADGREIVLRPLPKLPAALQDADRLHAPREAQYVLWGYATDLGTLSYVAASQSVTVSFPREPLPLEFALWEDGRASMRELADRGTSR